MLELNKVYCLDALEGLKQLEDEIIGCLPTDPPYGLEFMGKDWDKAVPPVEIWRECSRVLKSGAFMFVMCIPRADCLSRMIVNIENAGFNVGFTPIFWAYACLSSDTEVLTIEGWYSWEQLYKTNGYKHLSILIYSKENDEYVWEQPSAWNYCRIKGEGYHIQSEQTDQFVSANHGVYTGRGIVQAKDLSKQESVAYLPELPKGILDMGSMAQKERQKQTSRNILFNIMQAKSPHPRTSYSKRIAYSSNVRSTKTKAKEGYAWRKELGMERWSDLLQNAWELCWSKICSLPQRILDYGTKRWLCYGTSIVGSSAFRQTTAQNRNCTSFRSQSNKQFIRQPCIVPKQSNTQIVRKSKSYKTTLATITREHYEGIVFCPTVSTGCFVARRNGKIFLTGNSGFPKAANISLLIDKQECMKELTEELGRKPSKDEFKEAWKDYRKVVGINDDYYIKKRAEIDRGIDNRNPLYQQAGLTDTEAGFQNVSTSHLITEPRSPQAKSLDGSYAGFQPKPAVEVIIVAMKPLSEKTYVEQALNDGKGVTWLDDGRIPIHGEKIVAGTPNSIRRGTFQEHEGYQRPWKKDKELYATRLEEALDRANTMGRFPANLLVSDDILNNRKITKGTGHFNTKVRMKGHTLYEGGFNDFEQEERFLKDSGSFSRYFDLDAWFEEKIKQLPKEVQKVFPFLIVPKASKSERDRGLEKFPIKRPDTRTSTGMGTFEEKGVLPGHNPHPTVKSIALMTYLITIGSREGDLILDPFIGSGTTAIAARLFGRNYIGFDNEPEYIKIANARLNALPKRLEDYA